MFESVTQPQRANWKLRILLATIATILAYTLVSLLRMIAMPLHSYAGPLPALTSEEVEIQKRLAAHVEYLSATIGERNLGRSGTISATAQYLRIQLEQLGYKVAEQKYSASHQSVSNLEVILPGSDNAAGNIIVGAHYDTAELAPGANDNGTGVAAILELARLLRISKLRKTVRLVLFANE
ncbi:MAG TPA: M28 family peptidase, partial [Terriglobales bacterium]|nr:M28 family peptidase [Terriglobales bacterium]